MSHSITAVDRNTLPSALLGLAKAHVRVDFPDDDMVLREYLRFAISYFEQVSGWRVFGADVAWSPVTSASSAASRYKCPVQPVASFTVTSASVDVSADYALEAGAPVAPVWLVRKDGTAFPADAAVTLKTGYANPDDIEPSALGNILRLVGKLYEYRESIAALSLEEVPFWMNDLIVGHWIPRV